jgi:uncharacterized membrane protein
MDHVDYPLLVDLARDNEFVVHLGVHLGSSSLGHRWGNLWGTAEAGRGTPAGTGPERSDRGRTRTTIQDISFGVRQLVDIAGAGALPGHQRPDHGLQCCSTRSRDLRELAVRRTSRRTSGRERRGAGGHQAPVLRGILDLALDEVIDYADNVQVPGKLEELLEDVRDVARPVNRPPSSAKRGTTREGGRPEADPAGARLLVVPCLLD